MSDNSQQENLDAVAASLGCRAAQLGNLGKLEADSLAQLNDDILRARREKAEQISDAIDDALEQLPRILRGPINKLMQAL